MKQTILSVFTHFLLRSGLFTALLFGGVWVLGFIHLSSYSTFYLESLFILLVLGLALEFFYLLTKKQYGKAVINLFHNTRWRTLCLKTLPQMIKPLLKHFLIRFLAGVIVYVIAFVQYYFLDMMALITFLYGAILYFLYLLGELLYYSFARYDYRRTALNAFTIILHYLLYYL